MTVEELNQQVESYMKNASVADKKWVWNYFNDHDSFPIVTDEHLVSGHSWAGGEEVPF